MEIIFLYRELDELEREDFTRLKKVQSNKQEQLKIEEKARKAEKAAALAATGDASSFASASTNASNVGTTSALAGYDAADDDDVVFI